MFDSGILLSQYVPKIVKYLKYKTTQATEISIPIYYSKVGIWVDTILVMDRLKGLCSDTIIVMNYPLSGGSSISLDQEMQIFLLIKDYKDGIADFRIPDCITSVLSVNSDDFTVTGNIKRVNGFICRSLIFLRSQKLPSNTIKYEKLKRIINRSNDT